MTAWIYILSAVVGIILGVAGLVGLWTTRDRVYRQVMEIGDLADRTLEATKLTIDVAGRTLDQAAVDLDLIATLMDDLAGTLDNSGELIGSTADLIGEDMVSFVGDTQASLTGVQSSARFIDDFLGVISAVPFIGGRYRPEVPLQESVSRVNASLDPLPQAFEGIRSDLDTASANAATLQAEVEALGATVGDIETTISDARGVVDTYNEILADTQERFEVVRERVRTWANWVYTGLTAFLAWIVFSQVAALLHGIAELGERD